MAGRARGKTASRRKIDETIVIVAIHQPEHLPWLGFFDKAARADVLVLLDNVQYRKNYFQNRNRILCDRGPIWLTVPVKIKGEHEQLISQARIDNEGNPHWKAKCWNKVLQWYRHAPYFERHGEFFQRIYKQKWTLLHDLNAAIIEYFLKALDIRARIVRASDLDAQGRRTDINLDICRKLGATTYLSGISGQEYLETDKFHEAGIEVAFQKFHHPIYSQMYEPFTPCMSALDLLMNCGPDSPDTLRGIGVPTMEEIFS